MCFFFHLANIRKFITFISSQFFEDLSTSQPAGFGHIPRHVGHGGPGALDVGRGQRPTGLGAQGLPRLLRGGSAENAG